MNDRTDTAVLPTSSDPRVRAFLAGVGARLSDLPPDVQDELAGGLEADVADLVAERGAEALGSPQEYADELRSAAGLPQFNATVGESRRGVGELVHAALDSVHAAWNRLLDSAPGVRGFVETLQPVWWVIRAVVAWLLLQSFGGGWISLSPLWIGGLVVFVVCSVQLGRGAWGLGAVRRNAFGRVLLIGLNALAVLMIPTQVDRAMWQVIDSHWEVGNWDPGTEGGGLENDSRAICNIQPYDAQGRPLVGVQLLDGEGRPVVLKRCLDSTSTGAWLLGDVKRWNVFPQTRGNAVPKPPVPSLPAVTNPDVPQQAEAVRAQSPTDRQDSENRTGR